MDDPTADVDWSSVRDAFRPTSEELAEYARLRAMSDRDARATGLLEEARRRLDTDAVFQARVSQAEQVALAVVRARDPDEARRWLRMGAALVLVLELRDPRPPEERDAVRALAYALMQSDPRRTGGIPHVDPQQAARQLVQVLDALGYEVRPKTIEETTP